MAEQLSTIDLWMDEYQREFALQVSHRIVTRNFVARGDLNASDLQAGMFTLIFDGYSPAEKHQLALLRVIVAAQIELPERSQPLDVERAELSMLNELERFVRSAGGAEWIVQSVSTSKQMDHPFGWFTAVCEVGPLNIREATPDPISDFEVLWGECPNTGPGHEADYKPHSEFVRG